MYMYMATTAAAALTMAWVTYNYYSHGYAPPLDLKTSDLQLVVDGAFQGALHATHEMDSILYCLQDKKEIV